MTHRSYCFTVNNPYSHGKECECQYGNDQQLPSAYECQSYTLNSPVTSNTRVKYLCYQPEMGELGTIHLQGYVEFNVPVRLNAAKIYLQLPTAHFESRRGSRDQARDYCRKEISRLHGEKFFEYGVWEKSQGRRTDLDEVAELIKGGSSTKEIAEQCTIAFIKFSRGIEHTMGQLQPPPSRGQCRVFILYGDTGTGKSYACENVFPGAFVWPPSANSANYAFGYTGQKVCIFDEFYGQIPQYTMLRMCDRLPMSVNTQGANVPWLVETVIFTSNKDPRTWWKKDRGVLNPAFARRITAMRLCKFSDMCFMTHQAYKNNVLKWLENRAEMEHDDDHIEGETELLLQPMIPEVTNPWNGNYEQ